MRIFRLLCAGESRDSFGVSFPKLGTINSKGAGVTHMEQRDYTKLKLKLIMTTLCFSLVPLFVLGFSIYHQFSVSYTAKIEESLKTLAENRRSAIDLFFDERVSQLNTLVQTHHLDQLKDETYLSRAFTLMQAKSKSFVDLGIIDRDGNHVAYVGPLPAQGPELQ